MPPSSSTLVFFMLLSIYLLHRYNIQYGRVDANDSEVIAAAKCADIHDRILTFPDLYNTQVSYFINLGM